MAAPTIQQRYKLSRSLALLLSALAVAWAGQSWGWAFGQPSLQSEAKAFPQPHLRLAGLLRSSSHSSSSLHGLLPRTKRRQLAAAAAALEPSGLTRRRHNNAGGGQAGPL